MESKKIYRPVNDRAIFGVCGGIARYFELDPIVIRLAFVLLALMGTLGIWFYLIAAIVMPGEESVYARPVYGDPYVNIEPNRFETGFAPQTEAGTSYSEQPSRKGRRSSGTGLFLVVVGIMIIAKIMLPRIDVWIYVASLFIIFGLYLMIRKR